MAAIMGFSIETIRFTRRLYVPRRYSPRSGSPSASLTICARSAPAEKPRPSPRRMMQRISSSSAACPRASKSSSCMAPSKAFSLSGRCREIVATPPFPSYTTVSYNLPPSKEPPSGGAGEENATLLGLRRRRLLFGLLFLILGHFPLVGLGDQIDREKGDGRHEEHVDGDRKRGARCFE